MGSGVSGGKRPSFEKLLNLSLRTPFSSLPSLPVSSPSLEVQSFSIPRSEHSTPSALLSVVFYFPKK